MLKHDLTGKTFAFLTVIDRAPPKQNTPATFWRCACICGREAVIDSSRLRNGRTGSCGCKKGFRVAEKLATHGHSSGTPEYRSWRAAISRCTYDTTPNFVYYKGAGIDVCQRWRESFAAFLADMGPRPPGTTLDRIKNELGYEPSNCRWATPKEQAANRRVAKARTKRH